MADNKRKSMKDMPPEFFLAPTHPGGALAGDHRPVARLLRFHHRARRDRRTHPGHRGARL